MPEYYKITIFDVTPSFITFPYKIYANKDELIAWANNLPEEDDSYKDFLKELIDTGTCNKEFYWQTPFAQPVGEVITGKQLTGTETEIVYLNIWDCPYRFKCDNYFVDLLYIKDTQGYFRACKYTLQKLVLYKELKNSYTDLDYMLPPIYDIVKGETDPEGLTNKAYSLVYLTDKRFETEAEFKSDIVNPSPPDFSKFFSFWLGE